MPQLTIQQTFDLAVQHHQAGRVREAEQLYRQILAKQPTHAQALHGLGVMAMQARRNEIAVDLIRRAIAISPGEPDMHNNLGYALEHKGQRDEAIAAYRQAIALKPDLAEAHFNLGNALKDTGRLDEAIAAYRQAISLKPGFIQAHNNLAYTLLGRGEFHQGWLELDWRLKGNFPQAPPRNFTQELWDGSRLESRTLLLQTEQGFGDAIQFIRYLPLLAQREPVAKIILQCQPELHRLFRSYVPQHQVLVRGQPLPDFDFHFPLMSLPRLFATDLSNIPGGVPYIHADPQAVRNWHERVANQSPAIKVGLVWAGHPLNGRDRIRSIPLASLAPLGKVPGVRLFSLQKWQAAAEAKNPPAGMDFVDWSDELSDFADTAALIANLDLVISVDTAVVHLAGAMGKPIWTLLATVADWRWLTEREETPWYPTMRLFRQNVPGDWPSVIGRVVQALEQFSRTGR